MNFDTNRARMQVFQKNRAKKKKCGEKVLDIFIEEKFSFAVLEGEAG
jgi:hypothetical protein